MRTVSLFLRGRVFWLAAISWLAGYAVVLLFYTNKFDVYFTKFGHPRILGVTEISLALASAVTASALAPRLPVMDRLGSRRLSWLSGAIALVTIAAYGFIPLSVYLLSQVLPTGWMPSGEGFSRWTSVQEGIPSESFAFGFQAAWATLVVTYVAIIMITTALIGPVKGPLIGLGVCVLLLFAQSSSWGDLVPLAYHPMRSRDLVRTREIVAPLILTITAVIVWARTRGTAKR